MKVTVCELEDGWFEEETSWNRLIEHVSEENSDLVLLPEMPFSRLFPARSVCRPI